MRPFSIYQSCKEFFTHHQEQLLAIIKDVVLPDVVYLLGASLHSRRSESIFCPEAPNAQSTDDYYLLIIIPDFDEREQYEWQDQIELRCSNLLSVTTIVLKTSTFTEWAAGAHPFAQNVVANAPVIFNENNLSFPVPAITNPEQGLQAIHQFGQDATKKAVAFFSGAEFFRLTNQYPLSAFMLHQATEQSLRSILKMGTGYHGCTHNLQRLLKYSAMVSYELPDVFVRKHEKDEQLLKLLQKAYSDARYGSDYKITIEQLNGLTEKVNRIVQLLTRYIDLPNQTPFNKA